MVIEKNFFIWYSKGNKLSLLYQKRKFDVFLIFKGLLKSRATLQVFISCYVIISSVLDQLFLLIFRKISISITMILTLFFFYFFRKILIAFTCLFSIFVFFLIQKQINTFLELLFDVFLCFFIFNCHFYIEKETYKKCFVSFLYTLRN